MKLSEELIELRNSAIPRAVFQASSCLIDSAHGSIIKDLEGREWIDFSGGIGVLNMGHCPPEVVQAVKEQADRFLHACFHVSMYESYIRLADRMNQVTPGDFSKKTFFANSGAEAVENAVKIVRKHTQRPGMLCFDNAFHGRTLMGMSLTSKITPYKSGFGPFSPEVYRLPFPYAYRMTNGDQEAANRLVLDRIRMAFKNMVDPYSIAAIIFEPVQGEGGFISANPAFFQELRELTREYGILTVCDEIQTGFGRTGTLYASESQAIDYDIILSAKSMASGLPISAITGRSEVMDSCDIGGLGGTFGGNPLSCRAALATIELFMKTDVLERANEIGMIIKERFDHFKESYECVGDVRGMGAMRAFELVNDRESKSPATEKTKKLVSYCNSKCLSVLSAGTYSNVIRVLSPLTIDKSTLTRGLEILDEGLASVDRV